MQYIDPLPNNFPPPEFSYKRIFYFNRTDGIDDDEQNEILFDTIIEKLLCESIPYKIKALYKTTKPIVYIWVYRYDFAEYYDFGKFAIRITLYFAKSNGFKPKVIDLVIDTLFTDTKLAIKNTCIKA